MSQRYVMAKGTIADLNREAAAMWKELLDPASQLHQDARKKGIAVERLNGNYTDYLKIEKAHAPIVPGAYEILIAVIGSTAAAKVARDVWNELFLPWAKNKLGLTKASTSSGKNLKTAAKKTKKK